MSRRRERMGRQVLFNGLTNDPAARGNPRLPFAHRSNTSANDRILQPNGTPVRASDTVEEVMVIDAQEQ